MGENIHTPSRNIMYEMVYSTLALLGDDIILTSSPVPTKGTFTRRFRSRISLS